MLRLRGGAAVILSCTLLLLALISPAFASGPTDASAPAATAPAACTELLTNGDFEQQSASWTQAGAPGTELITEDNPRTGNYSAYLGGITNSDHSVRQQITLPAGQIITLKFWSYQNTLEHAPNMDDYLSVRLLRPDNSLLAERARYGVDPELPLAFQPFTLGLSAYAGQTVQLQFLVHNSQYDETWYFIDDVSVSACTAQHTYLPLIRR